MEYIISSNDFLSSINPYSLTFKTPAIEENYKKERFKISTPYKIVNLTTLFIWLAFSIRTLQVYLSFALISNPNNKPTKNLLILAIISLSSIALELIITNISRIRMVKGFIYTIPSLVMLMITTYDNNIALSNTNPYIPPVFTVLLICYISMAFLYCYNWICGIIILFLVLMAVEIMNLIYPCAAIDKAFMSFYNFLALICISVTLLYYEYQRRENFYNTYQLKIQHERTSRILSNLPLGIIVTENHKIIEVNKTFKEITKINVENNNLEERKEVEEDHSIDYNDIALSVTNNFKRPDTNESLKNYIDLDKEIEGNPEFNFCIEGESKLIPFEVTTTKIEIENGYQIIYTLKNMEAFHELSEIKARQKYSRMFIASISHDFRTYLNIIMGNLDIFNDGLDPNLRNNCYLKNIQNSTTFLSIRVQDLIDFSLLKEKKLQINLTEFNFIEVIENTLNLFEAKYKDKGLFLKKEISEHIPEYIHSDKMKITQVLVNLLTNSWKFTLTGGVLVSLEFHEGENLIIISVKDTGIGIELDNFSKLMEPFSRIEDDMHLNENGIGLGLYICKKLAKKLEGSISIASQIREGCQVLFKFKAVKFSISNRFSKIEEKHIDQNIIENPIRTDPICDEILPSSERLFPNKEKFNDSIDKINEIEIKICQCPKILIVDDEIGNRHVISNYSFRLNIKSEEAINGLDALEKVKNFYNKFKCCSNYKLIVMDSNMPVMNGEESTSKIRKYLGNHSQPMPIIICVTANATNEKNDFSQSLKIYDDFYYKPLRFESFKIILRQQHLIEE